MAHLLLEQGPAHRHAVLELPPLAVPLRVGLHLALALVGRQHVQLVLQLHLQLLALHLE